MLVLCRQTRSPQVRVEPHQDNEQDADRTSEADMAPTPSVNEFKLLYSTYGELLVSKKYYGFKLQRTRRYNLILESVIAVGATGSGVAGFTLFQPDNKYGAPIW